MDVLLCWNQVPLAHAVLRRDGISVDIITPGTFPDGKVRAIVGEISCSTADPAPSFSWLTTPQRRLSALVPEDCTTNETDSFCSAAVKLVPNNSSAKVRDRVCGSGFGHVDLGSGMYV
jgi:hypothetical protein